MRSQRILAGGRDRRISSDDCLGFAADQRDYRTTFSMLTSTKRCSNIGEDIIMAAVLWHHYEVDSVWNI
eukprot:scaffold7330_cov146-Cylindrotheca_fusiformis.AAC.5